MRRRVFCGVMAEQQNNLWEKCIDGKLEEVREALQAGADPNTTYGDWNFPCLTWAAQYNHDEVVALLLSSEGIKVNAKTGWDSTALHHACSCGSLASLSKLLAAPGVKLNERDLLSNTPIMWAIRGRKTEAVLQMAAVRDVDLDVKDNEGESLEDLANR